MDLSHVYTLQSTGAVMSEEHVIQDVAPVEKVFCMTTPDLVLPEDDRSSSIGLPSVSKDSDQNVTRDRTHIRRRSSGDAESMGECDALLAVRAEIESEVGG